jgi:type I restriction enzyme S subunit
MILMEKLQPKLRFPEFTGDWYKRTLSDLLTFKNGINASKEDYGSGYKFINVLDIIQNDFITHDRIIGSVQIAETEFKKNIVEYGDILFQRSSETREEVGQANVYLDKQNPATFGGFVIRGKRISEYDPQFMNYVLKTHRSRKEITSKSGGSTRYNVGQDTLSETSIITSELPEQQKIASFLSTVDEKIQLLKKQQPLLEKYKKGVMQKIFSRELRFKDENSKDFTVWEEMKLKDVVTKQSSNISANSIESNYGEYIIYGAAGEIKRIDFYEIEEDYISIVKDGAGVGRLLPCKGKSSVLGTLDILLPNNTDVDIDFTYYLLLNIDFSKYVTGSTIPHIYFRDYQNEKIAVPILSEQKKIGNFLKTIDEKIAKMKDQICLAEEWKKGLLQQLFV